MPHKIEVLRPISSSVDGRLSIVPPVPRELRASRISPDHESQFDKANREAWDELTKTKPEICEDDMLGNIYLQVVKPQDWQTKIGDEEGTILTFWSMPDNGAGSAYDTLPPEAASEHMTLWAGLILKHLNLTK